MDTEEPAAASDGAPERVEQAIDTKAPSADGPQTADQGQTLANGESNEDVDDADSSELKANVADAPLADGERLFSIKEIAEMIGQDYERLRLYTRQPAIALRLGGRRVRGVKGPRYPASSIAPMQHLMQAADKGLITPGRAIAWLDNTEITPGALGDSEASGSALAVTEAQQQLGQMLAESMARNTAEVSALRQAQDETNALLRRQITLLEAQAQARELPAASQADPAPPTPAPAPEAAPQKGFLARLLGR